MSLFALRTCLRRPIHMQPPLVPSRTRALSRTSTPTLPRLPVPDLHKTLQKYLKSIQPFLLEDEKRGGVDFKSALEDRVKLVNDFERGLGPLCQQRLLGKCETRVRDCVSNLCFSAGQEFT